MVEPYAFEKLPSSTSEEGYSFTTASSAAYLLKLTTLIDTGAWDEALDGCTLLKKSKYLFLIQQTEGAENRTDFRIGATVAALIAENLQASPNSIYVFDPETSDGKELKRQKKFQRWFDTYGPGAGLIKNEISIIEETETGTISSFIAILYATDNADRESILQEIGQLQNNIMAGSSKAE